jgi:hypothetical protein
MQESLPESIDSPTDPYRCQATGRRGQCSFRGIKLADGSYGTRCILHGGNKQVEAETAKSLKQYRLTKWQAKLDRFSESTIIKSLREEIGILRILLEERLNQTHDTPDLILQSGPISDLVLKIEKIVTSCHKLESRMGQHLDKAAVIQLASRFVAIISEELADQPNKIDSISNRLLEIIKEEER